jgi:hypothetical protein
MANQNIERINDKILAYGVELETRYPLPFVRYLLGTPTQDGKTASNEIIAPSIPPGTYAYPDTTPIGIGTKLYEDSGLTIFLIGDNKNYRHLFTSTGIDAGYILKYDEDGIVTFYESIP